MIVYYAPGGGLGHVTRARRVLEALGISEALIVASAADERDVLALPRELEGDPDAHAAWLQSLAPDRLIADTFPAGIQGELSMFDAARVDHVARLLRWDDYRKAVPHPVPRFHHTWVVEELLPKHDAFLRRYSRTVSRLDLRPTLPPVDQREEGDYWLIVHSGPSPEVEELVAYTEELRKLEGKEVEVRVATRCKVSLPPGFSPVEATPPTRLYPAALRIITAAGFNVMLETEPHRDRHEIVPFPRRFDDQFLRAARRRRQMSD